MFYCIGSLFYNTSTVNPFTHDLSAVLLVYSKSQLKKAQINYFLTTHSKTVIFSQPLICLKYTQKNWKKKVANFFKFFHFSVIV